MIVTDIKHIGNQVSMTTDLKKAIDFLQRPDIHSLPDGKVELNGQHLFALVQRYETVMADIPKIECHQKYIDVQFRNCCYLSNFRKVPRVGT